MAIVDERREVKDDGSCAERKYQVASGKGWPTKDELLRRSSARGKRRKRIGTLRVLRRGRNNAIVIALCWRAPVLHNLGQTDCRFPLRDLDISREINYLCDLYDLCNLYDLYDLVHVAE